MTLLYLTTEGKTISNVLSLFIFRSPHQPVSAYVNTNLHLLRPFLVSYKLRHASRLTQGRTPSGAAGSLWKRVQTLHIVTIKNSKKDIKHSFVVIQSSSSKLSYGGTSTSMPFFVPNFSSWSVLTIKITYLNVAAFSYLPHTLTSKANWKKQRLGGAHKNLWLQPEFSHEKQTL